MYFIKKLNNLKNNLNIKFPKFGTGGGTSRYKYIIIFIIFILSINIKSFGKMEQADYYFGEGAESIDGKSKLPKPNGKNVYEITDGKELRGFADIVNGYYQYDSEGEVNWVAGISGANAILKDNIEFNNSQDDKANLEKWHKYGKDYAAWLKRKAEAEAAGGSFTEDEPSEPENNPGDIWIPIGKDSTPYTGIFEGNNKTISGLFCNVYNDSGDAYAGLFGYVGEDGTIKNLGIKNSFIRAKVSGSGDGFGPGDGSGYGGGLIGYCEGGSVTSSYSKDCTVTGMGDGAHVGGLVGECYGGAVTNSYSSGCTVVGSIYSKSSVGGLIGECYGGAVTNSYSSGCTVVGSVYSESSVGGLIGECYGGAVTNSYSSGCEVKGDGSNAFVGGLIGWFRVTSGEGRVESCYSSGCMVGGVGFSSYGYGGGLIGYCQGNVTNSYSTNTEIKATGSMEALRGGICGKLNSGTISNCYYLKDGDLNRDLFGIGGTSSDTENKTKSATDAEFKNSKNVLALLNKDFEDGSKPFKQDNENDQDKKDMGSGYPILAWSHRVAYVAGSEVLKREYVHPVEKYKLSEKIKIGEKEYSGGWLLNGNKVTEVNTESGSVTVYGPEKILKIPVRVKINYDPSNNLEKWVRAHVRHDFFRKSTSGSSWTSMQDTEYKFDIDLVSTKIGVDGTKTQDFIFSYYIFKA
ncbi:MAG: hypothetical protein J6C55_00660, partial [Oscillospiraceae bacterium]|nr:hypothetical protein [Oscillospiraceae bacterium]